jgi:hypothetical protein
LAKHLTKADTEAIINIIDGWSDYKMTWDEICDAAQRVVGKKPTRQSLNANKAIKAAYISKKGILRNETVQEPLVTNVRVAVERIKSLESKVLRLEEQNRALMEQFVVWQYNAYKHGLAEHQLNEPLPRIDRDRTEFVVVRK